MKKTLKRLLSLIIALAMLVPVFISADITASAKKTQTLTMYQYRSSDKGRYPGKITLTIVKRVIYFDVEDMTFKINIRGTMNFSDKDGCQADHPQGADWAAKKYDITAKRSIYFFMFKGENKIWISGDKDVVYDHTLRTTDCGYVAKIHYNKKGNAFTDITKINNFQSMLIYRRDATGIYFKTSKTGQEIDTDFNKNNEQNSLFTSFSDITSKKTGTYVAKNDITLRSGPGYNYPVVSDISVSSVGEVGTIDADGVLSTASVSEETLSTQSATVATIIKKNETIGITKIENGWGYTTYKGVSGWLNLSYCSYKGTLITKPTAPTVKLETSPDIPATGMVQVSWDSVYDARYYKAVLVNSSGAEVACYENIYGTTATFTPQTEGVYTVKVYAQNNVYTSDAGVLAQAITVHGKSKVTYLDYNDNVIGTQDVSYANASTAPIAPEREGYTFYGWVDANGNAVSLDNVKAAKTVKAKYTKNKYQVMFLDNQGNQLGELQQVEYMDSAVPPEAPNIEGYLFAGWSSEDYKNVYRLDKSEVIKISPIYIWQNKEIPVTCQITEASRQKDGYYVIFNVENHVSDTTRGRAVVCLKTKSDKLVYTTESAAFSIPANTKKTGMEVFVPCEDAATKAEVIILDSFEKSIPISKSVSSSIDQSNMWSSWKFYDTDSNGNEVDPTFDSDTAYETRSVYQYRIKETATNNTNTKAGYTLYGTRDVHQGGWSGWSDSVIDSFNYPDRTRDTRTQRVDVYSSRTIYDYFHYYNTSTRKWSPVQYKGFSGPHTCSLTWQLQWKSNSNVSGWSYYGSNYCGACNSYNMWYPNGSHSESYVSGQKTQYSYRDTTYTYHFYRWSDWSDWQANKVTANDNREVKEKHQYRTKSISAAIEDDSGDIKTVSGKLDASLAGKYINLYVMKYDENSDWTNEYVGQSVIGSDGSYSFSFKLREEPSAKTGDMTAYIGIQGSDEMQAVATFEAPKAIHKVVYYNDISGNEIVSTQYVKDGESAVVPSTNPEKEGYIFAGWNNTCTNVKSDMEVRSIFVAKEYVIHYIDPRNPKNCKEQICNYGDAFTTPDVAGDAAECDSGYLVGWDYIEREVINSDKEEETIAGEKTVTTSTVVMAEYETKQFDVTFVGVDGEILETQSVEYDGYIEAPEFEEDDGVNFLEWDVDEEQLANVTDSITVNAIYYFENTTSAPTISLESGAYNGTQTVSLSCDTENSVIWYTLDGSDPTENPNAIEYTEPITITESTELRCYAGSINANDSSVEQAYYVIDGDGIILNIHNTLDDDLDGSIMVKSLSEISDFDMSYEGYTFDGFYYEDSFKTKVDADTATDANIIDVYAKYSICSYDVTFNDNDGNEIKNETVKYGEAATAPNMSDIGELVFTGWDGDYSYITGDVVFNPIYKNRSEIVNIELNRSNYTLQEGFSFNLEATVTPEDKSDIMVLWISSNNRVATVLDDGTVTAVGAGEATIYAVTEDGSAVAECKIVVDKNPNTSLCLKETAVIGLDSSNNLRGIPVDNNTAEFILSQFRNTVSAMRIVSADGDVLTGDNKVGTGASVCLMDGNKVVDSIKIVVTGDINGDGKINNMDVSRIARIVVKKDIPDDLQLIAADINGSGDVNNRDAAYLMRYLVGKETL